MLQKALLRGADLVEFVYVYQRKAIQVEFRILLAREVDAVRIVGADGRRDEAAAKCTFACALRADEQGRYAVGVFLVHTFPVRDHVQEPAVKQLLPMRVAAGNGEGERTDAVFAVPARKFVQEIFQRVEYRHAVGIDITADVPVPQRNAFGLRIQCNAVQGTFVDGVEAEAERVALAVFHFTHLRIVAEFITPLHEVVRL